MPLNFALLGVAHERGITISVAVPRLALLFIQSVFVSIICRPAPTNGSHLFHGAIFGRSWSAWTPIPQISLLVFSVVLVFLVTRAISRPKPVESGFAWALLALFLAFNNGAIGLMARAYVASAAIILVVSIVETSYAMAYHDELTGLPSRRAFNDATLRLEAPYTVAAVDIDHFKSVNDTYGHDTGDEVLCMVAANLARVTGGGRAFRVGGEEFTILFPTTTPRKYWTILRICATRLKKIHFACARRPIDDRHPAVRIVARLRPARRQHAGRRRPRFPGGTCRSQLVSESRSPRTRRLK